MPRLAHPARLRAALVAMLMCVAARALAPAPAHAIAGGVLANPAGWPYMVALVRSNQSDAFDGQFCGGTLVRTDWVVTAAHCVTREDGSLIPPAEIHAVVGVADLTAVPPTSRFAVDLSYVYPRWKPGAGGDRGFAYDIALLHLSAPAGQPIALPLAQLPDSYRATRAWVAGWGRADAEHYPSQLRTGNISVSTPNQCRTRFSVPGVVCGTLEGGAEAAICDGDSGGPLVDASYGTDTLIGVVNFGPGDACTSGTSGAYADVSLYRTWIAYISRANGDPNLSIPEISSVRPRDVGDAIRTVVTWCQDGADGRDIRVDFFLAAANGDILRKRSLRGTADGRCMTGTFVVPDRFRNGRYLALGKVIDVKSGMSFRSPPTPFTIR